VGRDANTCGRACAAPPRPRAATTRRAPAWRRAEHHEVEPVRPGEAPERDVREGAGEVAERCTRAAPEVVIVSPRARLARNSLADE
jgi:hypothetical protein